jgi:cysteinyl-tRNA synthetase
LAFLPLYLTFSSMSIRLYDSLSRSIREVSPFEGDTYRFYCCGPTVYGPAHIGNFRTFVMQDVFRRTLETGGQRMTHVRNLTDVDDKTIRESRAAGQTLRDFTRHWTEAFHADCDSLNLLPPHVEPAATEHIDVQIDLIKKLITKGHAYSSEEGSVYFRVSSFSDYGKLSRLKEREIRTNTRQAEGPAPIDADEYQRDSAADFALWKARKPEDGDVFWASPWGEGRPGWHLECSAMSMAYLGESFDMHGGGIDLVFPHHENEIAQSEACTCKTFARHWFHAAHLMVEGSKMSKSLGNLYTLKDVEARGFSPAALRYVLLSGHYRQPLNFTWDSLHSAESAIDRLARFRDALTARFAEMEPESGLASAASPDWGAFEGAWGLLTEDLNTPAALGALFSALKGINPAQLSPTEARAQWQALSRLLQAFGLRLPEAKEAAAVPPEITALAEERWQAKQNRDFAAADQLRARLKEAGWFVLDHKEGYALEPAND